ncbi:DUF4351 domain-containing protein [uncultured Thiodictyon sp.]|uniref:DUF4351 domain-containing protein n=1 Tax=uncultured Thiodictyon sp. TaxID=1846217 RepID=UPI0025E19ABB|nr:DUF4351 domain-containing protein [uncultured Thiodictyon sp.]
MFERFRALTAKEIGAMLNLVTPIQETRAYQSIFAEGRQREANLVLRHLDRRIGPVPKPHQERITVLPIDDLEALLDFADVADLNAWLAGH